MVKPLAALLLLALALAVVASAASWRTEYRMHTSKNDDFTVAASAAEPGYVALGISGVPAYLTPDEAVTLSQLLDSASLQARQIGEKK